MQITVEVKDELLEKAVKLTGIDDANELVKIGLTVIIARWSAQRFSLLRATSTPEERRRRPHEP